MRENPKAGRALGLVSALRGPHQAQRAVRLALFLLGCGLVQFLDELGGILVQFPLAHLATQAHETGSVQDIHRRPHLLALEGFTTDDAGRDGIGLDLGPDQVGVHGLEGLGRILASGLGASSAAHAHEARAQDHVGRRARAVQGLAEDGALVAGVGRFLCGDDGRLDLLHHRCRVGLGLLDAALAAQAHEMPVHHEIDRLAHAAQFLLADGADIQWVGRQLVRDYLLVRVGLVAGGCGLGRGILNDRTGRGDGQGQGSAGQGKDNLLHGEVVC